MIRTALTLLTTLVIVSCSKSDKRTDEFILESIMYQNHEIAAGNEQSYKLVQPKDSAFRDSTKFVITWIENLESELRNQTDELFSSSSKTIVNNLLFEQEKASQLKAILNDYSAFADRPGFKIWNIARDAKSIENPNDVTPFREYYFSDTNVGQCLILLEHFKTQILSIESRYYTFYCGKNKGT